MPETARPRLSLYETSLLIGVLEFVEQRGILETYFPAGNGMTAKQKGAELQLRLRRLRNKLFTHKIGSGGCQGCGPVNNDVGKQAAIR